MKKVDCSEATYRLAKQFKKTRRIQDKAWKDIFEARQKRNTVQFLPIAADKKRNMIRECDDIISKANRDVKAAETDFSKAMASYKNDVLVYSLSVDPEMLDSKTVTMVDKGLLSSAEMLLLAHDYNTNNNAAMVRYLTNAITENAKKTGDRETLRKASQLSSTTGNAAKTLCEGIEAFMEKSVYPKSKAMARRMEKELDKVLESTLEHSKDIVLGVPDDYRLTITDIDVSEIGEMLDDTVIPDYSTRYEGVQTV